MNKPKEEQAVTGITGYRRPYFDTQPAYLYPGYRSTVKRSPSRPLVLLPHTLTEVTGPVFGYDDVQSTDSDLTRQHESEPIGERIVVSGRLLDENSRPVADALSASKRPDPAKVLAGKQKVKTETLTATILSGKEYTVIVSGATKKSDVRVKVNSQ